ncbi:hypothetical protein JTE90_027966 [Oedothorax gibbosus]|uniref:MATH domain-containing protein n=1 Tax=Oedothorax gibbosus TaxID=931172 RepID=A0AAV6VEJ8_9ARAC|nr:hypothetical protein JTE90_027966 [Oedothorax gibbosus]
MDPNLSILFWEVCEELSKKSPTTKWKIGESVTSPVIRRDEDTSWTLRFYPSGVEETGAEEGLVFSLERDSCDVSVVVKVTIHLCHFTTPVKSYTMQCRFEEGDISYKCQLADVENIAKLGIFIPLQTLCVRVFLNFIDS